MKVAILFDAGSDEWSPQDVAAVVANVHEVRDVLRRAGPRGRAPAGPPGRLPLAHPGPPGRPGLQSLRGDQRPRPLRGLRRRHPRADRRAVHRLPAPGPPPSATGSTSPTPCSSAAGLPVPAFTLAQANKTPAEFPLPAIVKPRGRGRQRRDRQRRGLHHASGRSRSGSRQMLEQFEEVLVQEYVAGREFNVGFVGKRMLPIAEIRFDEMPEGTLAHRELRRQVDPGQPRGRGHPARLPGRRRRPTWPSGIGEVARAGLGAHVRRRGLRPGGPAGRRARASPTCSR